MNRILIGILALAAAPAWAQSAPESVLDQAMLLGPARLEAAGGQPTIFGEAGANSYVATLSGAGCAPGGSGCDRVAFQAVAPPGSPEAVAAWAAAGLGGSVVTGPDGWVVLTDEATLGDAGAALRGWGALMAEFAARFGN